RYKEGEINGFYLYSDVWLQLALSDVLHLEEPHRAQIGSHGRDAGEASRRLRQSQSLRRRAYAAARFGDPGGCAVSQGTDHGDQLQRSSSGKTGSDHQEISEYQGAFQPRGQ